MGATLDGQLMGITREMNISSVSQHVPSTVSVSQVVGYERCRVMSNCRVSVVRSKRGGMGVQAFAGERIVEHQCRKVFGRGCRPK